MKTVHKYPVEMADAFKAEIPVGAKFISVQVQRGAPQMWWAVDTDMPLEERSFAVCGTGNPLHPVGAAREPLGSFQLYGGDLIFHLFG